MKTVISDILYHIGNSSENNAFYIDETYFSYRQLGCRIKTIRNAVANFPSSAQIVGLVIHDDLDTYAAIIALWLEGKAYVPLNPLHPEERNNAIIYQLGIDNIIDSVSDEAFESYRLLVTGSLENDDTVLVFDKNLPDTDLAYILFTSGSTGTPKGVCISRGNVAAFMDSFWKTGITVTPEDRCLQCFDLTFDVSVQSFLVALTRGACVYTVPYGQVKYLYVARLIQEQGITFGAMAPSMLTYLRPFLDELDASHMRTCILTAEACPVDLLEDWYKCAKNVELYDFYGPTEATVYCTYYKLNRDGKNLSVNGVISIGRPLANVQAFILDEAGCVLPAGEKGELCVAGSQVTPGYWKNEDKNAASFFTKEIYGISYRLYHTGDLCYWDESGNIMYIGRIDQQAKIQGFRVELSEIEFHAREFYHKEKRVLAVAFTGENNLTEIALFVEAESGDSKELTDFLRTKMPGYMIPSRIVFKTVFPLNSSDKIDRNALKTELN